MRPREWLNRDNSAHFAYNVTHVAKARDLAERAFAAIDRGYPANPKVDKKLRDRADLMAERLNENALRTIVQIVAQWLSAREAPSAAPKAREAAESVAGIVTRIAQAQEALGALSEALRYSDTTTEGHDVQGLAQVLSRSLEEAGRALTYAGEWSDELLALLPAGAQGRSGVVSKLTDRGADTALAIALGRVWIDRGLTLAGGKDCGHGLNIILEEILGNPKEAEISLSAARSALKDWAGYTCQY